MKCWLIRIDWFVDGTKVIGAESTIEIVRSDSVLKACYMLIDTLVTLGEHCESMMSPDEKQWDERQLTLELQVEDRVRRLVVRHARNRSEAEAFQNVEAIVDWASAAETTDLLVV
jgi:hypothetical protein